MPKNSKVPAPKENIFVLKLITLLCECGTIIIVSLRSQNLKAETKNAATLRNTPPKNTIIEWTRLFSNLLYVRIRATLFSTVYTISQYIIRKQSCQI